MKIYDCFTFYNELDLLEIRLNELDSVVDYFVIVEATKTQTGLDKKLYFDLNKERYNKFKHKIVHIIVRDMPNIKYNNAWVLENFQRNKIMVGLDACGLDDIIFISDLDEIPNKKQFKKISYILSKKESLLNKLRNNLSNNIFKFLFLFNTPKLSLKNKIIRKIYLILEQLIPNTRVIKLKQKWYYYYLNGDSGHYDIDTRVCTYKTLITDLSLKPQNTRFMFFGAVIRSGWHFSWLMDNKLKLSSLADSEGNLNNIKLIVAKKIPTKIKLINSDYPLFLVNNLEKYKKYICEDYEK